LSAYGSSLSLHFRGKQPVKKDGDRPVAPSFEDVRVWLLVVVLAATCLAFLGFALSDSVTASAQLVSHTAVQQH
jgi:hypothetical protein